MLDYALFKTIVDNTPLISIDLIIYNAKSEVLLGKRN
ncbi:GDP-mannose mannosyl hydrolase, partial [Salmonella enterica]|nr:GDP-mannose mannosyl hydrolase [Salmonella enterica]ECJ8379165.1 GDP-mannose mannosyl hydrolase [Salmonella enterica]